MYASQAFWVLVLTACSAYLLALYFKQAFQLPLWKYGIAAIFPLIGFMYYGRIGMPGMQLNLRKSGWLKPFFIGFVWAGIVSFYPLLFSEIQHRHTLPLSVLSIWFFTKNWMFITVLCIMFDIKDYAADYNHHIKTFVVRTGLRNTIFRIIIPLSIAGLVSYILFVAFNHFPLTRIIFNSIPFILLIIVAWSLRRRKSILYYLAIIDGLMLVKAACGILGVLLTK